MIEKCLLHYVYLISAVYVHVSSEIVNYFKYIYKYRFVSVLNSGNIIFLDISRNVEFNAVIFPMYCVLAVSAQGYVEDYGKIIFCDSMESFFKNKDNFQNM